MSSTTATAPSRPTLLVRLADWSYRRRRRVLLAWIAVLFAAVFGAGAFGGSYHFTFTTPGSDSKKAQDLLQSNFPARAGDDVEVVFQTRQGKSVDDPAVQAEIADVL
ncbi:MAG: putative drug exporter of the superfamily, partial [Acidimicrobiaceae bacterium]